MDLKVIDKGDYVHFKLKGIFNINDTKRVIQKIREAHDLEKIAKAIIDFSDLDDFTPSDTDRYYLGKEVATQLSSNVKLASVAPSSVVNHFSETVALNRGAHLKIFTDQKEAIAWLLS